MEEIKTNESTTQETKEQEIRVVKWQLEIEARDEHKEFDLDPDYFKKRIVMYAECTGSKFYSIFHDKDVYNDQTAPSEDKIGKPKHLHYHLVLVFPTKKGKNAVLSRLSQVLQINRNRISAEACEVLSYALKYLTHKTRLAISQDKFRYDEKEVYTNDPQGYRVNCAIKGEELPIEDLLEVCKRSHYHMITIMRALGTTNFQRYQRIIEVICNSPESPTSVETRYCREWLLNNMDALKELKLHQESGVVTKQDYELMLLALRVVEVCAE